MDEIMDEVNAIVSELDDYEFHRRNLQWVIHHAIELEEEDESSSHVRSTMIRTVYEAATDLWEMDISEV